MEYNDSNTHVIKTSAQWNERAIEYWVVPRGCLCVELTPKGKTKIKIGEGNKNYYQLPYIGSSEELYNYYTKEEVDALLNNLNRMAIMSTEEYPSKRDLPTRGNKVGDVRFVTSPSPDIKPDPDLYVWDGRRWIYTGSPLVDMSEYVKTSEFNIVKNKVDQIFPMAHTHANKAVLDNITQEKLDEIDELAEMYVDVKTDITDLKSKSHTHSNKAVLDIVTQSSLMSTADRTKLDSLHNYDDTEVKGRLTVVESKAHTHSNKSVLDGITQEKLDEITELAATYIIVKQDITELKEKEHSHDNIDILNETDASYTLEQQNELVRLSNIGPFIGCGPTWNGIFGYVPAPEMGQQTYFLRADGTWTKVKSGGDKYKAGEGITILSGEVISDTFPFKVYSKSGHLSQYIIYGNTGGVGESMGGGVYGINITVTNEHGNSTQTSILLPEKISLGDYIDYNKQVFVHMRTDVSSLISVDPNYGYRWAIRSDGSIKATDVGAFGNAPRVTTLMELEPGTTYELYHNCYWTEFRNYMNINVYDTGENRTRTVNYYMTNSTTPTIISLASNEKYIRMTLDANNTYKLIMVKGVETPTTLPQIPLFPNSINTINVTNTIKPAEIYVEVAEPSDDDPDDPMSEYTGIIYNDGILDVTQEDPNNLNELTFHYRDNVDKTLTIPAPELPIASDTTLGGIKVGNNLTIDPVTGVLSATGGGGGTQYEAGTGINIISDSGSTVSRTLKVNAQTAQANDYTIYGASGGVGEPSINLMPQLTTSSIWANTWYENGTHEGQPAFSKNTWYGGITNEVYLTEGTYTFSLDVKLSSTSVQGLLANELNDQSRYPHYNQAATVNLMHLGPFYPVDTDWHRYSYTFEVTAAGYVACRAENVSSSSATITVARPQLEVGSVAHDYVEHEHYVIPIIVSAPNETDIEVFIETSSPLGNGDSLNFIDDSLPTLTLYQNKINTITVNTTVAPSRFTVDASSGSDVTSVIELDDSITIRFNCNNDPNEY